MKNVGEIKTIGVIKFGMNAIIFSYTAFRIVDEKSSPGYFVMLNGCVMNACAWNGLKVTSSKEAEARTVLATLKMYIEKGYATIQVCLDAIELVR